MLKPNFLVGESSAEWDRVLPLVLNPSELDSRVLANYCLAVGTVIEAEAMLRSQGLVVETDKGNKIPNPYMGIRNRAMTLAIVYAKECGFTPRARGEERKRPAKKTLKDMLE